MGIYLVAPNVATLALLAAGEVIIQVQVCLEEKHLLGLQGSEYEKYFSKAPRWL
jgi:protein-S-isoprenylcysteine O-methyltransferase Ste14